MAKYTKNNDGRAVGPVSPAQKRAEEANPPTKAETPAEIDPIDALQLVLDLGGMIPGAGAIPDLLNAAISLMRGDIIGALFSAGAAVPAIGDAAGAAKIMKNADKYAQAIKTIETKVLPKLPAPMRKRLEEYLAAIRKKIDALTKKEKLKEKAKSKDNDGAKSKPNKNHEKAAFGEKTAHDKMTQKGHEPVGKTDGVYEPGKTGIDGVYKNANPPPDYTVTEVKYGSGQLEKGLADGTNQMDDKWVSKRLEDKVGEVDARAIQKSMEEGRTEKWLIRVSENGSSTATKIDGSGSPIRGAVGKVPGFQ